METKRECPFYKKGLCRFGSRCWNEHTVPLTNGESGENSAASISADDENKDICENTQEPLDNKASTTNNHTECAQGSKKKKYKRRTLMTQKEFYGEMLNQDKDLFCSICLELFIKPTLFNCSHMFCEWCVESWSFLNDQCPICRVSITSRVFCLPFDNHIKKMVELGPDKIKKVYEELTNYRNEKGPLVFEDDEETRIMEEIDRDLRNLREIGYYSI